MRHWVIISILVFTYPKEEFGPLNPMIEEHLAPPCPECTVTPADDPTYPTNEEEENSFLDYTELLDCASDILQDEL